MKRTLSVKLTWLVTILVLLSVLGIAIPTLTSESKELKKLSKENAVLVMKNADLMVQDFIEDPTAIVESCIKYLETGVNDRAEIENYFEKLRESNPSYSMLYYASEIPLLEGGVLYSDCHWNPPEGWDYVTRGWYKDAVASNSYVVAQPYVDSNTGDLVTGISKAIYKNGKLKGVVALDMTISALSEMMNNFKVTESGRSYLVDSKGLYVTCEDINKIGKASPFADYNLKMDGGNADASSMLFTPNNGAKKYMAAKLISKETGWYFISFGPTKELYKAVNNAVINTIIITLVAYIFAFVLTLIMSRKIGSAVSTVDVTINTIASGNADLTSRITMKERHDEIGNLVKGFNKFVEKLQSIISRVKNSKDSLESAREDLSDCVSNTSAAITEILANIDSIGSQVNNQAMVVHQTSSAVDEIAENINSLERMIENQSSGVTQASSAVEQMIGNINSVNGIVDKMALSFGDLTSKSNEGMGYQKIVLEQITEIEEQSKSLQAANTAIEDVAQQTNLLAMNAAIEAAHAGEAGKGFSVVADEIRKLSESSTEQSKTIGAELTKILAKIEQIVEASQISSRNFNEVSSQIDFTDTLVQQIKAATDEQSQGSKQIVQALQVMNDTTSEVRNASKEMMEGNKLILKEVTNLQEASALIKQSMDEMAVGAKDINKTGASLSEITGRVNESIEQISNEIDLFKV